MARELLNDVLFTPADGTTVVAPPQPGPGSWSGAPSTWRDTDGTIWLVYRMRWPYPVRGGVLRIARSHDGCHFDTVWETTREAVGAESIERCALVRLAANRWRLWLSYVDPADRRWRIDAIDAPSPDKLDPATRRHALNAADAGCEGVKDPVIYRIAQNWMMYVSYSPRPSVVPADLHGTGDVFATGLTRSWTGIAVSKDAETWRWVGPAMSGRLGSWDEYAARLCTILPGGPPFVGFYDGSRTVAENYEERMGVAVSVDARHWSSMSPAGPAFTAPGGGSLRYIDTVETGGDLLAYYEMARPDGSHELRVSTINPVAAVVARQGRVQP